MYDIMKTTIAAGNLKTLTRAIQKAGLNNILSSNGPYTIFAPSDQAFSKFPQDKIENLLRDKDRLMAVVKSHIHSGKLTSQSISKLRKIKTINGKELSINTTKGICVENAYVIKPDMECTNGVIHIIDNVLQFK